MMYDNKLFYDKVGHTHWIRERAMGNAQKGAVVINERRDSS